MYVRVISDVHEEFGYQFNIEKMDTDNETILIMPGDLDVGHRFFKTVNRIVETTDFHSYIFIPGNHEYYKQDFNKMNVSLTEFQAEMKSRFNNVHIGTNRLSRVDIGQYTFLIGTMWTDGGKTLESKGRVGACLNDFHVISNGLRKFTVSDMASEFSIFTSALAIELLNIPDTQKVILVTHHLPSYECIDEMYRNTSDINGGFAVELSDYIPVELLSKIKVCVFGHTHTSLVDKIEVPYRNLSFYAICNPAGYPKWGGAFLENLKFDPKLCLFLDDIC